MERVHICVAKILRADPFPAARKPAYQLHLDLGPRLGTRTSSAQLPASYPDPLELLGKTVVCVCNLGERKIAGFRSQVLVLGMDDGVGRVWLVRVGADGDDGLVGRRVVVEGQIGVGDDLQPVVDIQEFVAAGCVERDGFVVLPNHHANTGRLGVYNGGVFVPLIAPKEAVPGAILH